MQLIDTIAYGADPMQVLDVYLPEEKAKAVFIYFHGGGLEAGSRKDGAIMAEFLTDRGIALVSVEYRMFPQAVFPEFIQDAASSVAWAKEHMEELCGSNRLFVGGSSAGGYLSMMLCFDRKYLVQAGLEPEAVSGYFHDAGQPTAHFNVLKYRGEDPRRVIVDETAPLYFIGTEKTYVPMRFLVSDQDMEGRLEQTMLVQATLKHFGYQNFDHVLLHGTHCAYCGKLDEKGESVLAQLVWDFLKDRV